MTLKHKISSSVASLGELLVMHSTLDASPPRLMTVLGSTSAYDTMRNLVCDAMVAESEVLIDALNSVKDQPDLFATLPRHRLEDWAFAVQNFALKEAMKYPYSSDHNWALRFECLHDALQDCSRMNRNTH